MSHPDHAEKTTHDAALTAASATVGRKKTWRVVLLALGAAGMLGVSTASASDRNPDGDNGARLVHQAKGCFSWGPPAPPAFA